MIRGKLREFLLADLLSMLASGKKTGLLRLEYPRWQLNTSFSFIDGRIGRTLTPFAPRITEMMLDYGFSADYVDVLSRMSSDDFNRNVTDEMSKTLVLQVLRRRIEIALLPLFEQPEGSFEFYVSDASAFVEPGVDPNTMLLDLSRRLDELRRVGGDKLEPNQVFVLSNKATHLSPDTPALSPTELRVIAALDDLLNLCDVSYISKLAWDDLARAIISLQKRNIIDQHPDRINIGFLLENELETEHDVL
jgi:hypothetical protein